MEAAFLPPLPLLGPVVLVVEVAFPLLPTSQKHQHLLMLLQQQQSPRRTPWQLSSVGWTVREPATLFPSFSPGAGRGQTAADYGVLGIQVTPCNITCNCPYIACGATNHSTIEKFLCQSGICLWQIYFLCGATNDMNVWTFTFCCTTRVL